MLIKSEKKYIPALRELWKCVFGDEYDYIDLFFKSAYFEAVTFAHFEDGEIVSALYLLDSGIMLNKCRYNGYYLYAAATKEEHRNKGIMSMLIEEAKGYLKSDEFIALVPADDGLYSYYSRFGFFEAMQKFRGKIASDKTLNADEMNKEDYYRLTYNADFDRFYKSEVNTNYSLDCLEYCGMKPYKVGEGAVITDGENAVEVFAKNENDLKSIIEKSGLPDGAVIETAFDRNFEKVRFGMVYTENEQLKKDLLSKKIYMNLALD